MVKKTYDFIVIGSGFGGSISAMRLTEKGYNVLVLERGKRFGDKDFAESDWNVWKHQWMPALRCFGIRENTLLNGIMILHGSGVGGGSLVYANVLMESRTRDCFQPLRGATLPTGRRFCARTMTPPNACWASRKTRACRRRMKRSRL